MVLSPWSYLLDWFISKAHKTRCVPCGRSSGVWQHYSAFIMLYFSAMSMEFFPSQSEKNCLTKPRQHKVADVIVSWMCCILWQKLGKLKLTWVTARLVFISIDKKWDIKKERETSDIHTDLRAPVFQPWSWQWGPASLSAGSSLSLSASLTLHNPSHLVVKFTTPRFLGICWTSRWRHNYLYFQQGL